MKSSQKLIYNPYLFIQQLAMEESVNGKPNSDADGKKLIPELIMAGQYLLNSPAGTGAIKAATNYLGLEEKVLEVIKSLGIDHKSDEMKTIKDDVTLLKEKLAKLESDGASVTKQKEDMERGLLLLREKYAVCMCAKTSVPFCFRWMF